LVNNDYIYENIIASNINSATDFFTKNVYLPNIKHTILTITSIKSNNQPN